MLYHVENIKKLSTEFNVNPSNGLSDAQVKENRRKYGSNEITKKREKNLFSKIIEAVLEPMILILVFSFLITLGTNIGSLLKSGEGDFIECIGILLAISLSVIITLVMEGSSQKAFRALNKIYDNISVKVIRNGKITVIPKTQVVVGDVVFLSSGDKIVADGRLISSNELSANESALTGESVPVKKDYNAKAFSSSPLAERKNMVYSGTFVMAGEGQMLVTSVGNNTEIGLIAKELSAKKEGVSPLNRKLNKLTKTITIIGGVVALIVFILSVSRLAVLKNITFETVTEVFISSIVLVVASVPEGLPAIVAVSLALNMTKLAKDNALIKKLIATETAGAVSVICSDKTGTLTENRMTVSKVCTGEYCTLPEKTVKEVMFQNFCANSTADIIRGKQVTFQGSSTEGALLVAYEKATGQNYLKYRNSFEIVERTPFSSERKTMTTVIRIDGDKRSLIKGAIEKILPLTDLTESQKTKIVSLALSYEKEGKRIIAFAHKDGDATKYKFDGYAVITDPLRKEVKRAVRLCLKANVKVKILTGDNINTAVAIAGELGLTGGSITADELMRLSDTELKKVLPKICVVARSTPSAKLRIVKALKEMGEVVAVTGDGINDAPAIRHADIGVAMGITGSEITKEAADVILLDDSFTTIVKAISFGRNVYRNLQRFIMFQLTVNLSAVIFIIVSLLTVGSAPFNTIQLLWINIIMDGPPALTLGLEKATDALMENKPIKRDRSIVTLKMFLRIIVNALIIATVVVLQQKFNFIGCTNQQMPAVVFTLFISFQLINALNCRALGTESAFFRLKDNLCLPIAFFITFILHVIIVQVGYKLFSVTPLTFMVWIKTLLTASLILIVTEIYKIIFRKIKQIKSDK